MDYKTYRNLRATDIYLHREDILDIIGESDSSVLSLMHYDLLRGIINYIDPDLSRAVAGKVLEMTSAEPSDDCRLRHRKGAYTTLIGYEMMHGRPYRSILNNALSEGIVPLYTGYLNGYDRKLILSNGSNIRDFEGLCDIMRNTNDGERKPAGADFIDAAMGLIDASDPGRLTDIARLSRFCTDGDHDTALMGMLNDMASSLNPETTHP